MAKVLIFPELTARGIHGANFQLSRGPTVAEPIRVEQVVTFLCRRPKKDRRLEVLFGVVAVVVLLKIAEESSSDSDDGVSSVNPDRFRSSVSSQLRAEL